MSTTNNLTSDYILKMLNQHRDALRELGAVRIGVFGSRVRGDARTDSDIDLLVSLADSTFETYCNVLFYLEDLFGCDIDLVPEDGLKPRIRPRILGEVIYAEGS